MNAMSLVLMFFLGQSPAEIEKNMEEIEKIDCETLFGGAERKCLNECAELEKDPDSKDAVKTCISQCSSMFSGGGQNCQKMQKAIKDFKKKSPDEREKILREALQEDAKGHHHH